MALIKCSECSAEISDKASCCPKCGAPVIVHKWRCSTCGNMISEDPCPYCGGRHLTVDITKPWDLKNTAAISAVPGINKRSATPTSAVPKKFEKQPGVLFHLVVTGITIAVLSVFIFIVLPSISNHNDSGTVVRGRMSDFYDDDGDGWIDRAYHRQVKQWAYFSPGEYHISSVQ